MKTLPPTIPLKHSGNFALPVLGLGTYGMGGLDHRDLLNDDKGQIKTLQEAIKLGFTHLDTAEGYADGYAETLIGQSIKNFDRRQLFITTKVRRRNLKYDDLIKAAQESLKRLDTPWIDLYLIHAANREIPLKESMRAMDALKENGLIKNIGVSNFNVDLLQEAMSYTNHSIVNNQIHYNLAVRDYEENMTIDFCQKNGIIVTAYRPLAGVAFAFDSQRQNKPINTTVFEKLAKKYGKTSSQVALNWLFQKPNVITLVKSTNLIHLKENLNALSFNLDSLDIKYLDEKFPRSQAVNLP